MTILGAGPHGETVRSDDKAVIEAWRASAPGFSTHLEDGRIWVFTPGSEAEAMFLKVGEPAKSVTRIGVGPMGKSVRSDDGAVIDAYLDAKEHIDAIKGEFAIYHEDGRIWVFEAHSKAHKMYMDVGEPAKSVTILGAGPQGQTVRSDDKSVILAWRASADGFATHIEDGRVWVFEPGSEAEAMFLKVGEPAKSVTRIGVGPMGMSVRSNDGSIIDAYLEAVY